MSTVSFFVALCIFCSLFASTQSKRFLFRLDDVEDKYHTDVQIDLLNFFLDRDIAVTAGIIGDYFSGTDLPIYNAMKRCVSKAPYKCALHNHGADATFVFSNATSVADAKARIKSCDDKIKALFNGYQAEAFVPHKNLWNQHTLDALRELGYPIFSAAVASYSNSPYSLTTDPLQISQQAATAVLDPHDQHTWIPFTVQETIDQCIVANNRGEVCVIEIHPHEFTQGAYSFTTLQQLVDGLATAGFTESVNFHTILKEVKGLTDSPTTAPTLAPTLAPSALSTLAPSSTGSSLLPIDATAAPTLAPSKGPETNTEGILDSSEGFFLSLPIWAIPLIVLAGISFLGAIAFAIRYYCFPVYGAAVAKQSEKDNLSDVEAAGSIEMAQVVVDEKYVPVSVRRSFRSEDEEIGTIAIPISSNIRSDDEENQASSHASHSYRALATESCESPKNRLSASAADHTHRSIATQN